MAGCAWTDVAVDVFPHLSDLPTAPVIAKNICAALALSSLSVGYLVATANSPTAATGDLSDRSAVEHVFLTGAMSFFSGWSW